MLLNPTFEVAGKIKLEAIRPDGSVRLLADWFDNLILNQGLNLMAAQTDYLDYCQCGSGTTAPLVTDVQLQSRIAGKLVDAPTTALLNTTDRYLYANPVYTFPIGGATGNISEIGIGRTATGTTLFSRALVKDTSGNPTTISVLADEQLRVNYQLRIYQPTVDIFSGTVGGYAVTGRSANVADTLFASGWSIQAGFNTARNSFKSNGGLSVYRGEIGPITSEPSGLINAYSGSSVVVDTAYVSGSFFRDTVITLGPNEVNDPAGIGAIRLPYGPTQFQFGFTPKIMKTNTQELKITLRYTWARRAL